MKVKPENATDQSLLADVQRRFPGAHASVLDTKARVRYTIK